MKKITFAFAVIGLVLLSGSWFLAQNAPQQPQQAPPPMTFFVTSAGSGKGADLGGLAGADALCQRLAGPNGANKTWRAYLSTQGPNPVNARDRIGKGPWHNFRGALVGQNIEEIHSMGHRFTPMTVLDEQGRMIPGGGFAPNRHDILTGSTAEGRAHPAGADMTCNNWTSSATGKAKVGHHDRAAWNSAHDSQGCSQEQLRGSGGDGLFYCFAAQ